MKKIHRHEKGSMLFVTVCTIAFICVPVLILLCQWGVFSVFSGRSQNVVEAAAKTAATDLARIVINDPEFGYVSLSNHPPVGMATCAQDGEPLPVTGINTLIGTLRQNAIIADEIQNPTMDALVDKDATALQSTIKQLNAKLSDSVDSEFRRRKAVDMYGKTVDPVSDVESFITENMPPKMQLESIKLTLGWLEGGSESTIPVPQPARLAQLKDKDIQDGKYQAFINYPVGGREFSFAGLDNQAHLVSVQNFREADGKHISSIVKVECTISSIDSPDKKVQSVVCCQPYSKPDLATRGAMTLRFTGRPVPGLLSWSEFLTNGYFRDNRVTTFDIVGGDYPYDKEAQMRQAQAEEPTGTSQQFSEHLYYWLRNGRVRPHLDAILAMINEPFRSYSNEVYTYEYADDGSIHRNVVDGNRFTRAVAADGQFASMADTRIKGATSAIILFRDNVMRKSSDSGKHGGQPLAGYPLNNLGNEHSEEIALKFSKRSNDATGLALDIEIGGTGDSTAIHDVTSMRERCRSRRI